MVGAAVLAASDVPCRGHGPHMRSGGQGGTLIEDVQLGGSKRAVKESLGMGKFV